MKCPVCGYLSFDNLEKCRKCGGSLLSLEREGSEKKESLRQEELFLPRLDKEESMSSLVPDEEEVEEAPPSPSGDDDDFSRSQESPAAAAAASEDPPLTGGDPVFSDGEEETPSGFPPPAPIIDDESGIPEDLWVEEGAGFLARLQAVAIDLAILGGVLFLFFAAAVLVLSTSGYGLTRLKTPEGIAALFLPFYLLGLFLGLSYFTFFLGWSGRTPGKALLRLEVRRTDGGEMTYTRGFLRGVGYLVSLTFAGLGFLWILFDERKRGWHDYLSGTWVKDLKNEG